MGFFDRWAKTPKPKVTLDELIPRAQGGDEQGAFEAATEKLQRVAKAAGASSPIYASALYDHGTLCLVLGMRGRAVEAMAEASAIRGTTAEDEKNRLTYMMNLGDTLAYAGQLEEALEVLERGMVDRERFYGKDHAGYAFGLHSWADVALALGRFDDAFEAARQTVTIYDACAHPRLAQGWALVFLAASGKEATWESLQVAPDLANAVVQELAKRRLPVDGAAERVGNPRLGRRSRQVHGRQPGDITRKVGRSHWKRGPNWRVATGKGRSVRAEYGSFDCPGPGQRLRRFRSPSSFRSRECARR